MENKNRILCPVCGKVIGEYKFVSAISSPLGAIPCYDSILDKKKASNIYYDCRKDKQIPQRGQGTLCKSCALTLYPEKKAYYIYHNYPDGKRTLCGSGNAYKSRETAEKDLQELEDRFGCHYMLEEKTIH